MDFYSFGVASPPLPSPERAGSPNLLLHGADIQILWQSWCDALVLQKATPDSAPQAHYLGTGLTTAQAEHAKRIAISDSTALFFGEALHRGLRCIVTRVKPSITLFAAELELELEQENESSVPETETLPLQFDFAIDHIKFSSSDDSIIVMVRNASQGRVFHFDSPDLFRKWLRDSNTSPPHVATNFPAEEWVQVVENATTLTALASSGRVFTWTYDARYPKCLGRPVDAESPADCPSPVPYLSEIKIVKIASGGYMTAAVSEDGELFLWGQACPGTQNELTVLKDGEAKAASAKKELFIRDLGMDPYLPPPPVTYTPWSPWTASKWHRDVAIMRRDGKLPPHPEDPRQAGSSGDEDDQDEFVKCVRLNLAVPNINVTDVAIGFGHILVATCTEQHSSRMRAIYAAGQNDKGQLGLAQNLEYGMDALPEFAENFEKLASFQNSTLVSYQGKTMAQMRCVGWSSLVVIKKDPSAYSQTDPARDLILDGQSGQAQVDWENWCVL
ncbi:hypothetical protein BDV95DRAFT_378263 [Massariosphaeria phaeospora]|uniref:Regulator of chromosome condensation 1/beta-lactamase-inhibitor protein II n=1 Tax=Massariosphaeria phaeospora TaxID=100035 RepID=A0A7C8M826_9PLEO|nr:hypothetical protein BDV95DRAFT_378263 [Massariosphaeria phaeospora]